MRNHANSADHAPHKVLWVALLCLLLSACGKPGQPAADSKLLQEARGRWLVINYWAEWCKPCREEIPELNQFSRQFKDKAVVYAVNFDGVQGEQLQQQIASFGIAMPVLSEDPAAELGFERPMALPSTYVFGPDGKLREVLQGQQTLASLAAAIESSAPAQ